MSENIFVIQALPTGSDGYPYDEIVDIAVCEVDLDRSEYRTVYHNVICYDPRDLGKKKLDFLLATGGPFAEE
ncbi:MAG: hypothetical protein LBU30_03840, partial [Candidatus Methanoplasma sp.]|nr:hypothetical protein [Candidatus Methanoplasma sp.]